jgi:hypothetical protein
MKTITTILALFGFYYLIVLLTWIPFAGTMNYFDYAAHPGCIIFIGMASIFATVTYCIEREES